MAALVQETPDGSGRRSPRNSNVLVAPRAIFDLVYNHAGGDFHDQRFFSFDRLPRSSNYDSLYVSDFGHTGGSCFALWCQEVPQFLIDNAKFHFEEYNADGLRHDQVSILLDANQGSGWPFLQDINGNWVNPWRQGNGGGVR